MERVVRNVYGHTRTHPDLEWFRPQEHNTLHPLFLYCSSKILEYGA
jgi:hypothetical protein